MPKININKIYIGTNRRPIKLEKVKQLTESIKTNGLLNPIAIDSQLNLIAGLHRLTACKQLGLKEIECNIFDYQNEQQVRLAEIDENLIRNELEALERAELWLERDRLLARMGLKAQPGDNQYTQAGGETVSLPVKTNLDFAQEIGYSKRTLQHGKQIAKDILPEVKDIIKGTTIANSPTKLLKVARAGNQERAVIEQAQQALEQAKQGREAAEIDRQMQILAKARAKQKELQLIALKNVMAPREVKLTIAPEIPAVSIPEIETQTQSSQQWILGRHRLYGGDTGGAEFINLLPGDAALAIATLSSTWNHDYAMEKARIVAVLRSQGYIYQFFRQHRMNFQYEFLVGNIYVGIFSHESISQPPTPIKVEGVEGIVNYLLHLYTSPNDVVIAPFMGQGEVLTTCEKMGRICIIGDDNRELLNRGMVRWQNLTGKQVENTSIALRG